VRDPKSLGPRFNRFLLELWKSRGGGFYGLGYVITFVWLEISLFFGDVAESEGVTDFVTQQITEWLFRFAFESMLNSLMALVWPFLVINRFATNGILALIAGYLLFQHLVKPRLDDWLAAIPTDVPHDVKKDFQRERGDTSEE